MIGVYTTYEIVIIDYVFCSGIPIPFESTLSIFRWVPTRVDVQLDVAEPGIELAWRFYD
tara:strand:+ start:144 stop:320 length:177 start_codon:yes stop_codon:yes gene_type:complete